MGWAYDRVYQPPTDPPKTLGEMLKFLDEKDKKLVESVAKAIYEREREEWQTKVRAWRIEGEPWDTNPDELCEWERDDYRGLAEAAIEAIRKHERENI